MQDQYVKAIRLTQKNGYVSVAAIQRTCRLGYNQALRLIERMQAEGIVSKPDERGFRSILDFYADPKPGPAKGKTKAGPDSRLGRY